MSSILIIDSGIGGLTVFREIQKLLPQATINYLADNAFLPYGLRTSNEINQRLLTLTEHFCQNHAEPDLLVIACNTASTLALPLLREKFSFPIVGIVPAIKPAALFSNSGEIALLATTRTSESSYTKDLIEKFAPQANIHHFACDPLVPLAEAKLRGSTCHDNAYISQLGQELSQIQNLDTVILACTHFPLLLDELKSQTVAKVNWLDPAFAVAQQCQRLLKVGPKRPDKPSTFWYTKQHSLAESLRQNLTRMELHACAFYAF